jgi:hypothetical protein
MCRSFVRQSRQMQEESEGAYLDGSVTELSTRQVAALPTNPSGSDIIGAGRRCAPKIEAAIGSATSSEAS